MTDYPDTVEVTKGTTMSFQPQLRTVRVSAGPDDEPFHVPMHWHAEHDEIITVLEGKLKVTVGGEIKICTPESGDAFVPRGVPHSLEGFKSVSCVFTERTNPTEFDKKELFFRNVFAMPGGLDSPNLFRTMQVFYHGDMFPVLPVHSVWLERALVVLLGGYIAPLLGYRVTYEHLKKT